MSENDENVLNIAVCFNTRVFNNLLPKLCRPPLNVSKQIFTSMLSYLALISQHVCTSGFRSNFQLVYRYRVYNNHTRDAISRMTSLRGRRPFRRGPGRGGRGGKTSESGEGTTPRNARVKNERSGRERDRLPDPRALPTLRFLLRTRSFHPLPLPGCLP